MSVDRRFKLIDGTSPFTAITSVGFPAGEFLVTNGTGGFTLITTIPPSALPGGFSGFAAATAKVGLTAVAGVATTAMRSDSAPALDQSISPTMTGNWTFTPTAGVAITINAFTGNNGLRLNAASGTGGMQINAASGSFASLVLVGGRAGTKSWEFIADLATAGTFSLFNDTHGEYLRQTDAGNLSSFGPNAAALVDLTPDSGSFTGTLTGMTAGTSGTVNWIRIGSMVTVYVNAGITGTSNTTAMTMTGLPAAIQPTGGTRACPCRVLNAGGNTYGVASFSVGSGTVTFAQGVPETAFGAALGKGLNTGWTCTYAL